MLAKSFLITLMTVVFQPVVAGQTPRLVDVGGYHLDVLQAGSGTPAIILVAGLGGALDTWQQIWPSAAEFSTVVAYSRAGLGRSESGKHAHTATDAVIELHALLKALQLRPPYVLVGKSYGGILVRLYTSLYPSEVGGLVIAEGSHEQQVQRWGKIDATYPAAFRSFFESRLKTLKPGAEADEIRETLRIQAAGAVEGMKPLPDIPIAVLTSMKAEPNPQYVNESKQGHEAWRKMHDEWFRCSRNGVHIVTTRSGHGIEVEEPQLIVEAIRFVLDRIRTESPLHGKSSS
jgi:pimeloyl-ACP methyl ester carboxylesterase